MQHAVTAVFLHQDEIFIIRRQPHLRAFPGYLAFPGGKIDAGDEACAPSHPLVADFPPEHLGALCRELNEELGFDLAQALAGNQVLAVQPMGTAVTPAFEPYRFSAHHFAIRLHQRPHFEIDENEIGWSGWMHPERIWAQYENGEALMVVPTMNLIRALAEGWSGGAVQPFNLEYDQERELPLLELVRGVGMIPVPSDTLPPARFTNALLLGDAGSGYCLVDPSPKDETSYRRLRRTLQRRRPDLLLVTHHHRDHHQQAPRLARELEIPLCCSRITRQRLLADFGDDYLTGIRVRELEDGERLTRWLGREILCHALPGHDDGMLGLAPEDLSWFFVSDLAQTQGSVVIPEPEGDMRAYFDSLERVIGLSPKVVIPSHGMPAGGTWLLWQTLRHRQQRETQIRLLQQEGMSLHEMVAQIYPGLDDGLLPLALQNVRQHLKKLDADGSAP